MTRNFIPAFLCYAVVTVFLTGCVTLKVEQSIQDGRTALLSGQPDDAVIYFSRAAAADPNYRTSYMLRESVWTYLGRAYYDAGKFSDARMALDKALTNDENDYVALLYHGTTLVRSNERDRGRAEMETALNAIHRWLEDLTSESSAGDYWDPGRQIRQAIETGLAGKPTAIELVVTAQRVGKQLEGEIDRAEHDKIRSLYNQGSRN